jgi:hypothetical protein
MVQFLIMMTCICVLVSVAYANRSIKYIEYIYFCFPCSLFVNHVLK